MQLYGEVAAQYRDFAEYAQGESPCFEEWAHAVCSDDEVLAWISTLPPVKQQPNLVFAAARWHEVPAPGPYDAVRTALLEDDGRIRSTILQRSTQTNEVGRLATLVPALSSIQEESGRPLALVEVGASAGLCLLPDRFDFAWHTGSGVVRAVAGGEPGSSPGGRSGPRPILSSGVTGSAPLPQRVPEVAWRRGVDLNPLDVTDADAMAWLTTLVWPEHDERRRRLQAAIRVARADPPTVVRGDLLEELPTMVEAAARHGVVTVFHSAVVAYLTEEDRRRFHVMMSTLVAEGACHWISNEAAQVLPRVTATGSSPPQGRFVLALDGRAVAWTHPHGRELTWL